MGISARAGGIFWLEIGVCSGDSRSAIQSPSSAKGRFSGIPMGIRHGRRSDLARGRAQMIPARLEWPLQIVWKANASLWFDTASVETVQLLGSDDGVATGNVGISLATYLRRPLSGIRQRSRRARIRRPSAGASYRTSPFTGAAIAFGRERHSANWFWNAARFRPEAKFRVAAERWRGWAPPGLLMSVNVKHSRRAFSVEDARPP